MKRASVLRCMFLWLLAFTACDGSVEPLTGEESVFVRHVVKPDPTECSYATDPAGESILRGTMDMLFTRRYRAALLVGNSTASRIGMTDASIRVVAEDGSLLSTSTVYLGGFVEASLGGEPGWGVVVVDLIDDPSLSESIELPYGRSDQKVSAIATVTLRGSKAGGGDIESSFRFPIDICYGCLVTFPLNAIDPAMPSPNCNNVYDSAEALPPCLIGQDQGVDCRICQTVAYETYDCRP